MQELKTRLKTAAAFVHPSVLHSEYFGSETMSHRDMYVEHVAEEGFDGAYGRLLDKTVPIIHDWWATEEKRTGDHIVTSALINFLGVVAGGVVQTMAKMNKVEESEAIGNFLEAFEGIARMHLRLPDEDESQQESDDDDEDDYRLVGEHVVKAEPGYELLAVVYNVDAAKEPSVFRLTVVAWLIKLEGTYPIALGWDHGLFRDAKYHCTYGVKYPDGRVIRPQNGWWASEAEWFAYMCESEDRPDPEDLTCFVGGGVKTP
jgi:hypothetical protein